MSLNKKEIENEKIKKERKRKKEQKILFLIFIKMLEIDITRRKLVER